MKLEDFIKTEIPKSIDFLDVEDIIAHLDECRKKAIWVDLTIKLMFKKYQMLNQSSRPFEQETGTLC